MSVRGAIAGLLERGSLAVAWPRALGRAHAHVAARALARRVVIPEDLAVVTVGGATLGGSGKTRVALAAARLLASKGARVVLVGHGYRAGGGVRIVREDDALADVGDEALVCARALAGHAQVVSGRPRQAAVDLAVSLAPDVLILDGPLQLAPVRAALALLAVDSEKPWGAGALPPAGDLRAPSAALIAHADHVVPVSPLPRGAWRDGRFVSLASLAGARIGLFTALARPDRLLGSLRQTNLDVRVVLSAPDHGPVSRALAERIAAAGDDVDLWLATEKCALHFAHCDTRKKRPLAVLDGECDLPAAVVNALNGLRPLVGAFRTHGRA